MKNRNLAVLLLLFALTSHNGINAMFEDQAFKFDWRQQYVGEVKDVDFWESSSGSGVIVRTASNVLASLDADSGHIKWRHIFADSVILEAALDGPESRYLVMSVANDLVIDNAKVSLTE
jgi:hypothetical protein